MSGVKKAIRHALSSSAPFAFWAKIAKVHIFVREEKRSYVPKPYESVTLGGTYNFPIRENVCCGIKEDRFASKWKTSH